jgi:signal transduction histidine kinase
VNDRRIKTVEPHAPSLARERKRSGNRSNRMHPECDTPAHRSTARELNEEGRPTGMEVVDHCAARIAHDLNNLLSTICGYGALALRQASGGETRRCIDKVLKASARAQALTQQLFALGRIPANPNVPVYIQGTVEEALEWMAITLPEGVQLQTDLRAEKVRVLADETQLYQIVMNLCTNAARAMEHRGALSVALDEVSVPFAQATTHGSLRSGVYVRLSVRDNGCGIPPGVLEHIFDPFFTTKAASGGSGLGLAIVSNIVHELGGAIDIRTEVGVGTTFAVWLGASVSDTVAIGTALLARDHA